MTDQHDYIARLRAKGLDATGVTEEVARRFYGRRGSHVMLIVEAKIEETGDTADGQHKVILTIQQVEPATDNRLDAHLRDLTRALHNERKLHDEDDQPQIDGIDDIEPTVKDVLAQSRGMLPDPPGDGGPDSPTCANCLHTVDHPEIHHEPEDGDEACTWDDCGHVVHADDTRCTKRECEQEQAAPVPG